MAAEIGDGGGAARKMGAGGEMASRHGCRPPPPWMQVAMREMGARGGAGEWERAAVGELGVVLGKRSSPPPWMQATAASMDAGRHEGDGGSGWRWGMEEGAGRGAGGGVGEEELGDRRAGAAGKGAWDGDGE